MKLTLISLSFLIQWAKAQEVVPIIEIESGKISGIVEQSFSGQEYFSYLGIPFAEPPTGDLRFKVISFFTYFQKTLNSYLFRHLFLLNHGMVSKMVQRMVYHAYKLLNLMNPI